jgi:hypothetical protein
MSSALLMERSAAPGTGATSVGWQPGATAAPGLANWCVLPRCEYRFEKCTGGFKVHCNCDDEVAAATLQNLCRMLSDGLCSCCATFNGIAVCQCSFVCGQCKCEYTKQGVCITCTSGDKKCCEMLQSCCDCLSCCCESGCCCYLSFNNTPVCCGSC